MNITIDGPCEWLEGIKTFRPNLSEGVLVYDGRKLPTPPEGWTPAKRAAHARKMSNAWTKERRVSHNQKMIAAWTPENRAKQSKTSKRVNRNAEFEVNKKRIASLRKVYESPEKRAELSDRMKRKHSDPEYRKNIGEKRAAAWAAWREARARLKPN